MHTQLWLVRQHWRQRGRLGETLKESESASGHVALAVATTGGLSVPAQSSPGTPSPSGFPVTLKAMPVACLQKRPQGLS